MSKVKTTNFIFNPDYVIKPDNNRVLLTYSNDNVYKLINEFIHPMHAILLSTFTGEKNLNDCLSEISNIFYINNDSAKNLVQKFINNKEELTLKFDGEIFNFPKNILIENTDDVLRNDIDQESLFIPPPYDFQSVRLSIPRSALLIINTNCYTDCIYCYADRKTRYKELTTDKILNIM